MVRVAWADQLEHKPFEKVGCSVTLAVALPRSPVNEKRLAKLSSLAVVVSNVVQSVHVWHDPDAEGLPEGLKPDAW